MTNPTVGRVAAAPGWTTSLVVSPGILTVQRHSDDPEFRARLVHMAGVLQGLGHPRTESFLALEDDGTRTTLVTAFAGGRSLANTAPRRARTLALVGASLLDTLADLHAAGFTHGPLVPSAVRLRGAEAILCGFVDGCNHVGDDPHSWRIERAVDERSVGRLLLGLVVRDGSDDRLRPLEWLVRRRLTTLATRLAEGGFADAAAAARALRSFAGRPARRSLAQVWRARRPLSPRP